MTKLYLPKYCILEVTIRECDDVSESAKIYFGELAVLASKHDCIYCTDEELAEMKGVGIRTIKRWHNELERNNFIKRITENKLDNDSDSKCQWTTKREMYICQQGKLKKCFGRAKNGTPIGRAKNGTPISNVKPEKETTTAAAVFYPCLKETKIALNEKIFLSERWSEQRVIKALQWINHPSTKINETFIQALKWACRHEPEIPKGNDPAANKKKAIEKLGEFDGETKDWDIAVLAGYVEFGDKRNGGLRSYTMFAYDKKTFWCDMMKFLQKNIPYIYKKIQPA